MTTDLGFLAGLREKRERERICEKSERSLCAVRMNGSVKWIV